MARGFALDMIAAIMPSYRRWRQKGGLVFLTVVTCGRMHILNSQAARDHLHQAIEETCSERPWIMEAVVLLPDHLHMIWRLPGNDDDYSSRVSLMKRRFTMAWLAAGGKEGGITSSQEHVRRRGVWQVKFWEHIIRDARDFKMHLDYIHINPVKHGHVQFPRDWPWSSFHRYVGLKEYEPDWLGRIDLRENVEYYWHDG